MCQSCRDKAVAKRVGLLRRREPVGSGPAPSGPKQALDRYDPWPLRIVLIAIGAIGLGSVIGITLLIWHGKDVQGFFTLPGIAITALSMAVSRRPPWTVERGDRG